MITERLHKELVEVIKDAPGCSDLTPWETAFLAGFQAKIARYHRDFNMTEAQEDTIGELQQKVYQT